MRGALTIPEGDFDKDFKVGLSDFAMLASEWDEGARSNMFDMTYDGIVDFADLSKFTDNWLVKGGGQGFIIGAPAEATCKRLACTRNRALFLEIVPTKTLLCRNQVVREEAHALRVRVSLHFVIEGHVC